MRRYLSPAALVLTATAAIATSSKDDWRVEDFQNGPPANLSDGDTLTFTIEVAANADALGGSDQLTILADAAASGAPELDGAVIVDGSAVSDSAMTAYEGGVELQLVAYDLLASCVDRGDGWCVTTALVELSYTGESGADLSWSAEIVVIGPLPEPGDPQVTLTIL